jgi:hypothetical protein
MEDPVEALMKLAGVAPTRQNYLDLAYLGKVLEELSAEEEAMLPKRYQSRTREER